MSTGCGGADCRPATCADQAASDRALDGIIWVGASR